MVEEKTREQSDITDTDNLQCYPSLSIISYAIIDQSLCSKACLVLRDRDPKVRAAWRG